MEQLAPGIERYRLSRLLFENAFTWALNETGLTGETRESKKLLEVLGRTCYESGIPEEEATQWTVERFLKEIEPVLIRLTFHNIYTTRKGFGEKPYIMPKQSLYLQTEEFMNRCYEFQYNKQTASIEYRQKKSFFFDFKPIDNRVLNSIAVKAMSEGIEIWNKDVRRWIESDKVRIYSPVEEFIYKLPDWDDKERIRAFASRVSCGNPHWPELFHRWFLGMVAQWIGRSARHANSVAPLLIGNQGCGKSTFCRMILPPELHAYYTDRIDFTLKKEAELYLNRFALINMDEFDQISPKEQAFLKHILQKPVIQTRKPHQSQIQSLNRYASFIGTSNHPDLLTDTSGSRRFICIRVEGTIDNLTPVNYYQLYAQAFEELQHGTRHWFDEKGERLISEYNQEFEQRTPIEQLFCQYYRAPRAGEVPQKLLAVEIFENIRKKSRLALPQTKITSFGRILKKLDIPVQRTQYGNCYLVVEIPQV
ncbi:MAG: DUF3874 domain-containing protein [Bacteroides sp.]|nr:DUF3874 domain-containing protein [Bacteroides sp.]